MFEVYHSDYDFPVAKFLFKSDAEMFIDITERKLPEIAKKYYIVDNRFKKKKEGLIKRFLKWLENL